MASKQSGKVIDIVKYFLGAVDAINNWVGNVISYVVHIAILVTLIEVISRFAFGHPTIWAQETTTHLFGFYSIMAGGYLLLTNYHTRVDVLWSRFSPRGRAVFDLCTSGFVFLFLGMLFWQSVQMFLKSFQIGEVSQTPFAPPLYPLKASLVLGSFLILLQFIVKFIRDIHTVVGIGQGIVTEVSHD